MTTALLAAETLLLLLLLVLVAGLLRSHAEILRRLGPAGQLAPPPPQEPRSRSAGPALPVTGTTPSGDAVSLSFEGQSSRPTLLAFLTSGCTTCSTFWEALGQHQPPGAAQAIVITRGADREQPGRLRKLQPDDVPVVMSSEAWEDYGVPGAPYFVLVDDGVRGEGMATSWDALRSLIADAIEDQRTAAGFTGGGGESRARQVDERLAAAGIGADHPSLYPGGRS